MIFQKKGLPEEGDIIICTVKKILFHSVFVSLDEYENKEGMIHISEVAPGRIRNIRDYVKEGKKIVCKVLKIDISKGHIDLSLRRVNNSERINKNTEFKQEQKAEKLLEHIGKANKKTLQEMYEEIGVRLINKYGSLRSGFQNISMDNSIVSDLKLNKSIEESVIKEVNDKIKPPEVMINANLSIQNSGSAGIEVIKEILEKIKENNVDIKYLGAPRYRLTLIAPDYKSAEAKLKSIKDKFLLLGKENNCIVDFNRTDGK